MPEWVREIATWLVLLLGLFGLAALAGTALIWLIDRISRGKELTFAFLDYMINREQYGRWKDQQNRSTVA